jgi:hypothetical protein
MGWEIPPWEGMNQFKYCNDLNKRNLTYNVKKKKNHIIEQEDCFGASLLKIHVQ